MKNAFTVIQRIPTVDEYTKLRESVGWRRVDHKAAEDGLKNSLFSLCAFSDENLVGYGRVIGDGGLYLYIQDVIVIPEFQRRGIGTSIMNALMKYMQNNAQRNTFVGLMAAEETMEFYMKFGFKERPEGAPGMFTVIE